jgi:hypothetical protein
VWPELCIAIVIKRNEKKRVVEVTRKMTWGTLEQAQHLLHMTIGCQEVLTEKIAPAPMPRIKMISDKSS